MLIKTLRKTICIDCDVLLDGLSEDNWRFDKPMRKGAKTFLKELSEDFNIMLYSKQELDSVVKWLIYNKIENLIYSITQSKPLAFMSVNEHLYNYHRNYNRMLKAIRKYGGY